MLGTVSLAAALAAGVALFPDSGPTGLGRADSVVDDDVRWSTAAGSADALSEIATLMLDEAADCQDETLTSRCADLLRSSAWAQVAAVRSLRCTQAYIAEVRENARNMVDTLGDDGGLPQAPPTPIC